LARRPPFRRFGGCRTAPECVVVADVELVTDWGGSGEGRVAGISASTAHCMCASICVALMAASLWCFFNSARTCKVCFFGAFAQASGHSHTAFFVLCRRRRCTHPPARPSSRAQCPVGYPVPPATGSGARVCGCGCSRCAWWCLVRICGSTPCPTPCLLIVFVLGGGT
jgi:hypothetical protein